MHNPVSTVFVFLCLCFNGSEALILHFSRPFTDPGSALLESFLEALSVHKGRAYSAFVVLFSYLFVSN